MFEHLLAFLKSFESFIVYTIFLLVSIAIPPPPFDPFNLRGEGAPPPPPPPPQHYPQPHQGPVPLMPPPAGGQYSYPPPPPPPGKCVNGVFLFMFF